MIVIRPCEGFDEFEACVQLQVDTWGYDPTDVIPRKTFFLAHKIGGQVIGAYDTDLPGAGSRGGPDSMVGFAMSLPGMKTGSKNGSNHPIPYLHSHMLAVRGDYRDRGLGMQIKLEQRLEALSRGIQYMEWTFDPLEIKNAFLNIHKLGATVSTYFVNFYGVSSSRLQGGLPTDRLLAEWRLDSPRVAARLDGQGSGAPIIEERIVVPASIYEWKASDSGRERALAVQLENRLRFQKAFAEGLVVVGFSRDADRNGIFELGPRSGTEFSA